MQTIPLEVVAQIVSRLPHLAGVAKLLSSEPQMVPQLEKILGDGYFQAGGDWLNADDARQLRPCCCFEKFGGGTRATASEARPGTITTRHKSELCT